VKNSPQVSLYVILPEVILGGLMLVVAVCPIPIQLQFSLPDNPYDYDRYLTTIHGADSW